MYAMLHTVNINNKLTGLFIVITKQLYKCIDYNKLSCQV